jgi:Ca2+-binding RTX toxin-like protein
LGEQVKSTSTPNPWRGTVFGSVAKGFASFLVVLLGFGLGACGGSNDTSSRQAAIGLGDPPPTGRGGTPPGADEKPPADSTPSPKPPEELQQLVQEQQKQSGQRPVPDPRQAKRSSCTITGTDGKDVLKGTNRRDVICGLGGDDVIKAGAGRDGISGGPGRDTVDAGSGNDVIPSRDGEADKINGGPGRDTAELDPRLDRATAAPPRPTSAASSSAQASI